MAPPVPPPAAPAPLAGDPPVAPPPGPTPGDSGGSAWIPATLALLAGLSLLASARLVAFGWLEVGDAPARAFANGLQALRADGFGAWTLFLGERAGGSALLARLVVVLLHLGSCGLAWLLARRLGLGRGAALFAAALFAVHPLAGEALAWLAQRGRLLGTFFLLGAAALALARPSLPVLAGLALGLAVLAEPGYVLGGLWILLARRHVDPAPREATSGRSALALAVPALLALLARLSIGGEMPELAALPASLVRLLGLALAPLGLRATHPQPEGFALPEALLLAVLTGTLLLGLRRAPRVALGGLFFLLIGLGALLGNGPASLRESAGYGATFGLALALAAASEALLARAPTQLRARALGGLGALLVVLAAARSLARQPEWRSEPALLESTLARWPDDVRALDRLGEWHKRHGRLSLAESLTQRALELAPRDASARLHLGELYLHRGLIPGQEGNLRTAERAFSACEADGLLGARVALRLGEVHLRAHDPESALPHLERAATLDPYDPMARSRLGMASLQLARFDDARAAFARATELGPDNLEAWSGLGLVALQQGDGERARACLERALALEPDHVESRTALGRIEELSGNPAEAERCYRRAIGVNPDYVDGLWALGALLATDGNDDEALRCFDRVVGLSRAQPHVRASLASARLRMRRGEREVPLERVRAVLAFNPAQAEARSLLEVLEAMPDEAPR